MRQSRFFGSLENEVIIVWSADILFEKGDVTRGNLFRWMSAGLAYSVERAYFSGWIFVSVIV